MWGDLVGDGLVPSRIQRRCVADPSARRDLVIDRPDQVWCADDAVDIVGSRWQVPFTEGPESIGVHLNSALGLSNEPEPPHTSTLDSAIASVPRSAENGQE